MQVVVVESQTFQNLIGMFETLVKEIKTLKSDNINTIPYDVPGAAKRMNVSEKTLRSYIESGKLNAINMNAGTTARPIYKVFESDIRDFWNRNRVK